MLVGGKIFVWREAEIIIINVIDLFYDWNWENQLFGPEANYELFRLIKRRQVYLGTLQD